MAYSFNDFKSGQIPPKGWDCADAVRDGWTRADLDGFMRATVQACVRPEERAAPNPEPDDDFAPLPAEAAPAAPHPRAATPLKREVESRPLLHRSNPLRSARVLVADRYTRDSVRTLQHWRGSFYRWDAACYAEADHDAVKAAVWNFLECALHAGEKGDEAFVPNLSRVTNVFAALAAACNLPAHTEAPAWLANRDDMPPASEFLAVKNGLLHLPSGDLYPPAPGFFGLNSAGTIYDPDAPEPTEWLRFLSQIWQNDRQSVETLQDLFGYLLSPDTSQQKIGLIVGPKRSGKGTIQRVMTGLFGHGSVAAPTLASLATNFGLAPLIGKSVGIIGDARLSSRADQATITERLLSISGEDTLTIDRKFLPAWTGRLGIRFLIMTNELPHLVDASGALASRFVVLTMEQSFYGKEDRGLGNRLLAELPGILNWSLQGYSRLQKRGYFQQPASAGDAIAELEALGSPVATFIKDRCVLASGKRCRVDTLFNEWVAWCGVNGRKEPGTAQTFGRDLKAAASGIKSRRFKESNARVRGYEGIGIAGREWDADVDDDTF